MWHAERAAACPRGCREGLAWLSVTATRPRPLGRAAGPTPRLHPRSRWVPERKKHPCQAAVAGEHGRKEGRKRAHSRVKVIPRSPVAWAPESIASLAPGNRFPFASDAAECRQNADARDDPAFHQNASPRPAGVRRACVPSPLRFCVSRLLLGCQNFGCPLVTLFGCPLAVVFIF